MSFYTLYLMSLPKVTDSQVFLIIIYHRITCSIGKKWIAFATGSTKLVPEIYIINLSLIDFFYKTSILKTSMLLPNDA